MAISANAVTLAQYALMSNAPLVQAVTMSLIENGSVMQDIPFVTKQTLVANGVRFVGNLPTVNWAKINEEGATTSGTPTPFQEQAYTLRNYIDTDKLLVQDVNHASDRADALLSRFDFVPHARIDDVIDHLEQPRETTMLRVVESKAAAGEVAISVTSAAMRVCGGAAFG